MFGGREGSYQYLFLCISSILVNLRLHTENQFYTLPGSALKVCVVGGGWVGVESEFSDADVVKLVCFSRCIKISRKLPFFLPGCWINEFSLNFGLNPISSKSVLKEEKKF